MNFNTRVMVSSEWIKFHEAKFADEDLIQQGQDEDDTSKTYCDIVCSPSASITRKDNQYKQRSQQGSNIVYYKLSDRDFNAGDRLIKRLCQGPASGE